MTNKMLTECSCFNILCISPILYNFILGNPSSEFANNGRLIFITRWWDTMCYVYIMNWLWYQCFPFYGISLGKDLLFHRLFVDQIRLAFPLFWCCTGSYMFQDLRLLLQAYHMLLWFYRFFFSISCSSSLIFVFKSNSSSYLAAINSTDLALRGYNGSVVTGWTSVRDAILLFSWSIPSWGHLVVSSIHCFLFWGLVDDIWSFSIACS